MAVDAKAMMDELLNIHPENPLAKLKVEPANLPQSRIYHVKLTREQAHAILNACRWDVQRRISYSNTARFDEIFIAGAWDDYSTMEMSSTPEGYYLNDGQNRLNSIVNTGDRFIRIIDTPFDTIEQARLHFANTDRNGLKRSIGEAMTAYLYNDHSLNTNQRTKLATALRFMNSAFNAKGSQARHGRKFQDFEYARAIREWKEVSVDCFRMIARAKRNIRNKIYLCPVLSVMLVTMRYNPEQATKFWDSVIADSGLVEGQPEKALIVMLTSPDCTIEKMGANVMARKVAAAYNNYCDGDDCVELKAYIKTPISMVGTPYTNKADIYYEPGQGLTKA